MKKVNQICITVFFVFVITIGFTIHGWQCSEAFGNNDEKPFVQKSTPTSSLMRIINSHTAKMLEAIMVGDFNTVIKKSNEVAKASNAIMRMFFPEGKKVDQWFTEIGKDPDDPDAVKSMKEDFERYSNAVIEASGNIAEVAKNRNIAETYKSFEAMLKNACFACHEVSRAKK
ncbi:MAG: cytochrome c [Planctomycetota bacterium]